MVPDLAVKSRAYFRPRCRGDMSSLVTCRATLRARSGAVYVRLEYVSRDYDPVTFTNLSAWEVERQGRASPPPTKLPRRAPHECVVGTLRTAKSCARPVERSATKLGDVEQTR